MWNPAWTRPPEPTKRLAGDYDDTYSLSEADVRPYIEPTGKLIKIVDALARTMI